MKPKATRARAPDVRALQREIAELKQALAEAGARSPSQEKEASGREVGQAGAVADGPLLNAQDLSWLMKNMANAFVVWGTVWDEAGRLADIRFDYFNDAYERVSGLRLSDAQGKTVKEVWPTTEQSWFDRYEEVALTGKAKAFELYHAPTRGLYSCNAYRPWGGPDRVCCVFEDITEQRGAERALRESEERYRQLIEVSPEGMLLRGSEGLLSFVNPTGLRILGAEKPEQVLGRRLLDFVPSEEHLAFQKRIEEILSRGEGAGYSEERFRRLDGQIISVEVTATLLTTSGERGVQILLRDLTERKQAEQALRASEAFLEAIIEHSPLALWVSDKQGTMLRMNQACRDMLQVSDEQLIGKYNILEDKSIARQGLMPLVRRVFKNGERVQFVLDYDIGELQEPSRVPKIQRLLEVTISPVLDGQKRATHAIIQTLDVTERERAEEELDRAHQLLEAVIEQSPVPMVVVSAPDFVVRYTNHAARSLLGVADEPDPRGQSLEEVARKQSWRDYDVEGNPLDLFSLPLAKALRGESTKNALIRVVRRDGTARWELVNAVPVYSSAGELQAAFVVFPDITEHKEAEVALREGRERLALALQGAALGSWDWDVETGAASFDDRFAEMLGYQLQDIKSSIWTWRDSVHSEDYPVVERTLLDHVEGRTQLFESEHRLRHRTGHWRWVLARGKVIERDASGKAVRAAGTLLDITQRKQAEAALRYRQEFEHLITQISSQFINLAPGEIHKALHRALQAIGEFTGADRSYLLFLRESATIMDNTHEWCAEGIPAHKARLQGLRSEDYAPLANQVKRSEVVQVTRVEEIKQEQPWVGNEHLLEGIRSFLLVPIEFGRAVVGCLGLDAVREEKSWALDTVSLLRVVGEVFANALAREKAGAALRASEERYRVVSEITGQMLYDYTVDTGRFAWAGNLEGITGYSQQEYDLLGLEGWKELIHPEDRARAVQQLDEALQNSTRYQAEYRYRRKDGHYLHVEHEGVFFYDGAGVATHMIGALKDQTARKKAESERTKLEEQLQQAMKMEAVGRLAGGVAHDFNNILTAILGNTDLAKMQLHSSDPLYQHLNEVAKAAESAASLTRQLLAFSRKQIIEPEVVCLNDLLGNLHKMLARLLGEDIILETLLAPKLDSVRVDVGQFEQVVVNLAVNARDSMPRGGRLQIETANTELDADYCARHPQVQPGPYVLLAVSDTGHGMTPEVRKRVFEPFFTTKPKGRGTGLGLATIFGTVQQAAGVIEVYSEVGVGTTFKIFLPRVEGTVERSAREESEPATPKGHGTVLLVEDEEAVRELACRILQRLGYTVLQAPNGGAALLIAERQGTPIDLLMTDVVMPEMNGRELAERLVRVHPKMKVLFTSGYTENVIVHPGVVDPHLNFLAKPYSYQALAKKISEVLRRS